jgi:transcriptional regulator with XRE-family HTH domain
MRKARDDETLRRNVGVFLLDWTGLAAAVSDALANSSDSLEVIAQKAGIGPSTLWDIKSGKSETVFRQDTLRRLARAFGRPANEFDSKFRVVVPYDLSELFDLDVLGRAAAAVIKPELAEIKSNMGRIYERLGMDPMHGSADCPAAEVGDESHAPESASSPDHADERSPSLPPRPPSPE